MSSVTIWILLALSNGAYNYGTVTVIERFVTAQDCVGTATALREQRLEAKFICVEAKVIKP